MDKLYDSLKVWNFHDVNNRSFKNSKQLSNVLFMKQKILRFYTQSTSLETLFLMEFSIIIMPKFL